MEIKDYWTTGLSIAAFLVSLLALKISHASFRLARDRDLRELEKERPSIELTLPACYGTGPWKVPYAIRNRSADNIVIVGIRLPINLGETAVPDRAPFRFEDAMQAARVTRKSARGEAGDYEMLKIEVEIPPSKVFRSEFSIMPEPRDRIKRGTEFRAYIDVKVRDRDETTYDLPILRRV